MKAHWHNVASRRSRLITVVGGAAAVLIGSGIGLTPLGAAPAVAAPAPTVGNAGFESGLDGWTSTGVAGSATGAAAGQDSDHRLNHWLDADGTVTTGQSVSGLTPGWWTFSAAAKSGGPVGSSQLVTSGCAVNGATTVPSTETDDRWLQLSVSAYVTGDSCTVGLTTSGAGAWASLDSVTLAAGQVTRDIRGADLSGVPRNEDHGAEYFAADGSAVDPVEAFADAGANLVRLKVWVDPADGYNDTADVVAMALRAKAAGMQVLVDFHYSDRWTDPGAQGVPAAWVGMSAAEMTVALTDYTTTVMTALVDAGVTPYAAQVGNEINPGMLWPLGQTWDVDTTDTVTGAQWDTLAGFLTAGSTAVTAVSPSTKVMLHLTNINNGIDGLTWWFDEVAARSVPFDLIGLSYYGFWHGTLADMQEAVTVLSGRYDRDVIVVETSYPFTLDDDPNPAWENVIDLPAELVTGYPATPAGQAANFRAVQDVVAAAPGGRGLGVVYWEPAWTSVPGAGWDPADPASGNAWENQAVFDFDGRALPALLEFAADPVTPVTPPVVVPDPPVVVVPDPPVVVVPDPPVAVVPDPPVAVVPDPSVQNPVGTTPGAATPVVQTPPSSTPVTAAAAGARTLAATGSEPVPIGSFALAGLLLGLGGLVLARRSRRQETATRDPRA